MKVACKKKDSIQIAYASHTQYGGCFLKHNWGVYNRACSVHVRIKIAGFKPIHEELASFDSTIEH